MARKTAPNPEALGASVIDSAQKIWLAGLGAFSRARTEGDSMFNLLVEQGKGLRDRARDAADQALKTVRTQADSAAGQAQGQWDKLEQVFEDRVSRSLNRLGVLTRQEVEDLSRQVQELNESVQALMRSQASAAKARATGGTRKRPAAARKRKAKRASRG
jgi:poly(hydroxyalkanoate) granule-associated protein